MAPLYRLGGGLYRVTVSVTGSSQAHGATARDLEAGS
jgi:hypothetical protein